MGIKVKGQYIIGSAFWTFKYMNESVFSKARYMNGVGFEIPARTPEPHLPPSYPPPQPPPHPTSQTLTKLSDNVTLKYLFLKYDKYMDILFLLKLECE